MNTKAACAHCGQTLIGKPDVSDAKLKIENCVRCGWSNYIADDRPCE